MVYDTEVVEKLGLLADFIWPTGIAYGKCNRLSFTVTFKKGSPAYGESHGCICW